MSTKIMTAAKNGSGTQRESFESGAAGGIGVSNTGALTEMESLQGVAAFAPADADNETTSPAQRESAGMLTEAEEFGSENPAAETAVLDAFFASYPPATERSGGAQEVIIGTDDRVRINPTTAFPWRAICALKITAADGSRWIGTGWFVSARTVITAGHCVYIHDRGGWVRSVEVIPAANGALRPFGSATTSTVRSVNGWTNSRNSDFDYGAIILPQNSRLGDRTGWFGLAVKDDAFLSSATLNLSGYPGDKGGNEQWFMSRRAKSLTGRRIVYDIDTMGGQSGAPVWYLLNGQRYAVGVHTNGHSSGNSATRIVTPVFNNLVAWKNQGL
jgi:glutamyl endopeptidase